MSPSNWTSPETNARTKPSSRGAQSSRRKPRRWTNTTVAAASGSPATEPSQHLIRIGNGPPAAV